MTTEELVSAMFSKENWPEDLPMPGEDNITDHELPDGKKLYRYDAPGYGMEIELDMATCPEPELGVVHMLNQFAYLYRNSKEKVATGEGNYYRTTF